MFAKKTVGLFVVCLIFASTFAYSKEVKNASKASSKCVPCEGKSADGQKANPIKASIVTDTECAFCSTKAAENVLKKNFQGMQFRKVNFRGEEAKKIIEEFKVETLPFFIIEPNIKDEKNFKKISNFLKEEKGKVILKKSLAGVFLFLKRKEAARRIDLFLDFYAESTGNVFSKLAEFSKKNKVEFNVHFIVSKNKEAAYPKEEVEAVLAVRRAYPKKLNDYINLRIKNIKKDSWMNTLDEAGIDYGKIRKIKNSKKGKKLLEKNMHLIDELNIRQGNVMLVNNNRIFKVFDIDPEELKKLFK